MWTIPSQASVLSTTPLLNGSKRIPTHTATCLAVTKTIARLFTMGVVMSLLSACHPTEEAPHATRPKLEVTLPLRKDTIITKEYVCQIHAIQHIEMRALERGYLQHVFADEGQLVKQGQPMFKIMPNVYEVELLKAEAETKSVQIEYENTKALAEKNIVSLNELALAKAKLEKAQAEVKLAQTHLNFTNINAPFTGVMDHLAVRKGSLMAEGDLLTTLSDNSRMWVYFNVPESEYLDFRARHDNEKGVKVRLRMANGQVFDQPGSIETIEADFDNKTGNIAFRAGFNNPSRVLRHGETGTILLDVAYPNAMLIPQKATFEILDKIYVYVVNKQHKLEQRLVQVAAELPHVYLIQSGLKDDDHILLEGLRRVHAGDHIDVNMQAPAQVMSGLALYAE